MNTQNQALSAMLRDDGFMLLGTTKSSEDFSCVSHDFDRDVAALADIVYVYVAGGVVWYVGQSGKTFPQRAKSHWGDIRRWLRGGKGECNGIVSSWQAFVAKHPEMQVWVKSAGSISLRGHVASTRKTEEALFIAVYKPIINTSDR